MAPANFSVKGHTGSLGQSCSTHLKEQSENVVVLQPATSDSLLSSVFILTFSFYNINYQVFRITDSEMSTLLQFGKEGVPAV